MRRTRESDEHVNRGNREYLTGYSFLFVHLFSDMQYRGCNSFYLSLLGGGSSIKRVRHMAQAIGVRKVDFYGATTSSAD